MGSPTGWSEATARLILASQPAQPTDLADLISDVLKPLGVEMAVYLVDREQTSLRGLPRRGVPAPPPLTIDGTLAGRAFTTISSVVPADGGGRVWMPVINGSDRLGAVEIRMPEGSDPSDLETHDALAVFVGLVGHLVAAKLPYGDALRQVRRSRPMSVGGELLWRVLPPLTFTTENLSLAALLEPCYEVGGDAFDYAVDNGIARVAMFDAVGHDLSASVTVALTLAATRAARARGDSLPEIARAADRTLMEHFQKVQFTTAVLADIDLSDGTVHYVNAGHPPPVLVRHHKAVALLDGGRRTPLGVGDAADDVAELALHPGDRLLFYTDGVVEARDEHGGSFGLDRLVDFVERHDSDGLPAPETLRRLRHSVLAHQRGRLQDDASLMIIEWGPGVGSDWAA